MTESLVRMGYTEREAAFLRVAALLSGCFERRHFNRFIDRECGALAQRFIERGIRLGHLKALPAFGGRMVYQISGSQLYSDLGDPENRNRREHRPRTIRRRMMALDFAVSVTGVTWLLTPREKLSFFSKLGIPESDLPAAMYNGKRCIFPDKQPVNVSADGVVRFVFIDEGLHSLSHWALFLKVHRGLLKRLEKAGVVFASFQPSRFSGAEELFRRTIAGETVAGGVDVERLAKYFTSRKLFEERRYESFDQNRLDELRENQRVYSGGEFERLYESWRARGDGKLAGLRNAQIQFQAVVLPKFYEWLSPIRPYERRAQQCP